LLCPKLVTIEGFIRQASVFVREEPMSDNRVRQELRDWTRARGYWDRAAEFLKLASDASDADVQNRYVTIARHYRTLAEAEERGAEQKGTERRSRRQSR
jgi:hypothetical protein